MINSHRKGSRGQTTRAIIVKVVRAMAKGHSSKSITTFVVELAPRETKEKEEHQAPPFAITTRGRWPQPTNLLKAQTASSPPC